MTAFNLDREWTNRSHIFLSEDKLSIAAKPLQSANRCAVFGPSGLKKFSERFDHAVRGRDRDFPSRLHIAA
jgi:hypothetical protein